MSVTGEPQGLPQKVGATIIDAATVQVAAQAVLAALFRRERIGAGETIHISLLEVALNLQLPNWSDYRARRRAHAQRRRPADECARRGYFSHPRRHGGGLRVRAVPLGAPVRTIGCPALATDARFLTNELRAANRPAMKAAVSEQLSRYGTRDCVDLLTRNNIVVGVVRSYSDALEGEDFQATSMVVDAAPNGDAEGYRSFGLPYELRDTPRPATRAAPAHGANTEEILRDAGFEPDEIAQLREAGVVKTAQPTRSTAGFLQAAAAARRMTAEPIGRQEAVFAVQGDRPERIGRQVAAVLEADAVRVAPMQQLAMFVIVGRGVDGFVRGQRADAFSRRWKRAACSRCRTCPVVEKRHGALEAVWVCPWISAMPSLYAARRPSIGAARSVASRPSDGSAMFAAASRSKGARCDGSGGKSAKARARLEKKSSAASPLSCHCAWLGSGACTGSPCTRNPACIAWAAGRSASSSTITRPSSQTNAEGQRTAVVPAGAADAGTSGPSKA